jgi:hypothetical protein
MNTESGADSFTAHDMIIPPSSGMARLLKADTSFTVIISKQKHLHLFPSA